MVEALRRSNVEPREITEAPNNAALRRRVRALLAEHVSSERLRIFDEAEEYDLELFRLLGSAGLLALDSELHGAAPSHAAQAVVLEELGAGPTSVGVSLVVQFMGLQLLHAHGSSEQRERFLAPLRTGDARVSFGLSEAEGGTDIARAMSTTATKNADGSYTINGAKKWIGGAMDCDFFILLARTSPLSHPAVDGITTFLIPRSSPGIRTEEIATMGIRGLAQCDVTLDNVRVGADCVLGDEGRGFRQVLDTLNGERLNGAAVALGIARGALDTAVAWAADRRAFGRPVGAFQALQHDLVDAAVKIEAARLLLQRAAQSSDTAGSADQTLSAMAKLAASSAATGATDTGMRVMAGWGMARALPMQRLFRDARLYTFAPITDEMTKNYLGEKLLGLPRSY
ncbi:acyl-CoA dehydrogenase family protein [Pseudarthrobacter phenanthrenivorans]|uniref:acyl-CoA dehydrogenase family protein n=1 Tax=Pseudarthrobacter phenanthrenivorans TaxID=361575 RepID=UPI00344C858A